MASFDDCMLRVLAAATVMAVISVSAPAHAQGAQAAVVKVDRVEVIPFSETAPVIGRMTATNRSVVAARVAGVIDTVAVDVGTSVREGDVLATLDSELMTIERDVALAAVEEAIATLAAAQTDVELAEQVYGRAERLRGSAAFSRSRLEDQAKEVQRQKSRVMEFRAKLENARAALARAEYQVRHMEISAPFSGVIVERAAHPGAYVDAGDPVITLLDAENLEIEADVPSELISGLAPGIEIVARLDDGTIQKARLRAVVPDEMPTTRTRAVRFVPVFSDMEQPLATGQTVVIQVPASEEREVVTVSKDALVQSGGRWVVYVAKDETAELRPIEIGQAIEGRFEVLTGLAAGDLVVVRGNERLSPGQPIQYEEPAPTVTALQPGSEQTPSQQN